MTLLETGFNLHGIDNNKLLIPIKLYDGAVSFIYVFDMWSKRRTIYNVRHPDLPISGEDVELSRISGYIIDVYSPLNVAAYTMYVITGKPLQFEDYVSDLQQFIFNTPFDVNIIPISKWVEVIDKFVHKFLNNVSEMKSDDIFAVESFRSVILPAINRLNQSTIKMGNTYVHNKYNPYTMTGRPTNVNTINFMAIPHASDIRYDITSRFENGILIEYDFKSYHPMLMLRYIVAGHVFDEYYDNFYLKLVEWLKVTTNQSYDIQVVKKMVMRSFYSMDDDELSKHPIFEAVMNIKHSLMNEFQSTGFIRSLMFKRRIYPPKREDMNGGILLSYLLQSIETERNFCILNDVFEYLYQKGSLLLLYVYDSFLIDYNPIDGPSTLYELSAIIGKDNFPVTYKVGHDYGSLVPINFLEVGG